MPSLQDEKIIIRPERTPSNDTDAHNPPEVNEMAILIVDQSENVTSREIVLEKHNSQLQRVNELHHGTILYNTPYYFLMLKMATTFSFVRLIP